MDDKKKIIRICLLIVYIIFAAVLIEVIVTLASKGLNKYVENKEEKKNQEEYENTYIGKNNKNVNEYVSSILSAIKAKDYDYIFSNLNPTYKEYKFRNNLDNLKSYINENYTDDMELSVLNVNTLQGLSRVTVGITRNDSLTSRIFTVNIDNDGSYSILLDSYNSVIKSYCNSESGDLIYTITSNTENAKYHLLYEYISSGITYYVFEIENISDQELKIEFDNVKKLFDNGKETSSAQVDSIKIAPQKSERIEVSFRDKETYQKSIIFECKENGTQVSLSFSSELKM